MAPSSPTPNLRSAVRLLVLLACGCLCGCSRGPDGPETALVTGTVVDEGQPVEAATVLFQPVPGTTGQSCQAQTNAEGQFELSTWVSITGATDGLNKPGAIPGDYQVAITKLVATNPTEMAPPAHVLPERYASPSSSALTASVVAGAENQFEFVLEP